MTLRKTVLLWSSTWVVGISILHAWLNLDLFRPASESARTFKVGFIPVT